MADEEQIPACKRCKNHKVIDVEGLVSNGGADDSRLVVAIGDVVCGSDLFLNTLRLENLPCIFVTADFHCKFFNSMEEPPPPVPGTPVKMEFE
jgi:hypothetical protein